MERRFIPSWPAASSRNRTSSSKPRGRIGERGRWTRTNLGLATGDWRFVIGHGQSAMDNKESDGCLVVPTVFKTAVGSFHGSRYVRFVPSPPFDCGLRIAD